MQTRALAIDSDSVVTAELKEGSRTHARMCSRSFSRVWYPVMFHLKPSNIIFGICVSLARRPFTSTFINMSAVEASCATADENSVAFVTVPNVEVGKELSHGIVKNKLAACVNLIPQITSIYEWEGKINEDSEVLLMIKTRKSRVDDLTEYVRQNHPYSVCEVISLPIQNGNPAYLDWINTVVPHKQNIENK